MFERILIANRGEVAARVARTCGRIGADTVALHEPGEEGAVHVQACDEAFAIEAGKHKDARTIVEAAVATGCQAIHAGYGLFDGDPTLASRGLEKGIVVVEPAKEMVDELSAAAARVQAAMTGKVFSQAELDTVLRYREEYRAKNAKR